MRAFSFTAAWLILLAAAAFTPSTADRLHEIRYGDTLWNLSSFYYNNPLMWETILNANPEAQIFNLRPGETLVIPFVEGETQMNDGMYATAGLTSSRSLLSRLQLETTGMVIDQPSSIAGYIVETNTDENDEFGDQTALPGDELAIDIGQDQGAEVGRVYRILEIGEEVRHPETDDYLGKVVRVAGVCRVIETSTNTSLAILEHGYLQVVAGQVLVPYTSYAPIEVSGIDVINGLDAYVVAFQDRDARHAYAFDVIYLDQGSNDGLQPGDLFNMYQYGSEFDRPSGETVVTPDICISEMVILDTTQETAAAMIYGSSSADLVDIGDRIHLVRQQQ
jgi:hypothetical protein